MLTVLTIGLAAIVSYAVIWAFIWPLAVYFWDPKKLRKFPAPGLWGIPAFAGWSNAWLGIVIAKYARSAHVQAAHDKYGKIVRIQPNHLSFIEPQALKDIYGFQSKMLKDAFYETFSSPDLQGHNFKSIVNTPDREEHSRKRKYISNAFAQRTVVTLDPLVNRCVAGMVKQFDKFAVSGPPKWPGAPRDGFTNLYRWINLLAYDIVGEISFGEPLGLCEKGDDEMMALPFDGSAPYKTNIIDAFQGGNVYDCFFGPWGAWPNMVHKLKTLTSWHHNSIKNKAFGEFVNMEVDKRLKRGKPEGFRDFMSYFLESGKGEELNLEYGEQWREASILLAGGTDTSTSSMTYTIYLLLKNPRCLEKLRQELDPVMKGTDIATWDQVGNLPYLRAVIEEALRERPPVGQGLPRVVPEGGAVVAGHFIEGKSIHCRPPLLSANFDACRWNHCIRTARLSAPQRRCFPQTIRIHPGTMAGGRYPEPARLLYSILNWSSCLHRSEYRLFRELDHHCYTCSSL
jgi:cytochrome P450